MRSNSPARPCRRGDITSPSRTHPDAPVVFADEKRLVQAVTNLLNNAAKYTPPEGHISVETVVEGDTRPHQRAR